MLAAYDKSGDKVRRWSRVRRSVACQAIKPPKKKDKETFHMPGKSTDPARPGVVAPQESKPFLQVLTSKLFDTGDDIMMHASRAFRKGTDLETQSGLQKSEDGVDTYVSNKPVVLVLGFGWAAHSMSKACLCLKFV
jgi:hypothetical protein